MRRGTLVVIVFVILAAIVVGVSQFLQRQPPLEFTVAVNPLAEDWLREAVTAFNNTEPVVNATQRIRFNVVVMDDLSIWRDTQTLTLENHPAVWIPTATASVDYADRYSVLAPSLAQTPLVWGGYSSRVNIATREGALRLDWDTVQAVTINGRWQDMGGESSWGFPKLAFARADMTMSGLGSLFSAAASYAQNPDLSGNATRDSGFRSWMEPVIGAVPNFQTLGTDPAATMARGPSTAEIGLLPEALWLRNLNGLSDDEPFVFSYPAYQFILDFPLATWGDPTQITDIERLAAGSLSEWLMSDAQQANTVRHGLRPADGVVDENAALFTAAEASGISLAPDMGMPVQPPSRNEAAALVQWFSTVRR